MPTQVPRWLKFVRFETFEAGRCKGEPRLVYRNLRTGRLVRKPAGWLDVDEDLKFRYFTEQAKLMLRANRKGRV